MFMIIILLAQLSLPLHAAQAAEAQHQRPLSILLPYRGSFIFGPNDSNNEDMPRNAIHFTCFIEQVRDQLKSMLEHRHRINPILSHDYTTYNPIAIPLLLENDPIIINLQNPTASISRFFRIFDALLEQKVINDQLKITHHNVHFLIEQNTNSLTSNSLVIEQNTNRLSSNSLHIVYFLLELWQRNPDQVHIKRDALELFLEKYDHRISKYLSRFFKPSCKQWDGYDKDAIDHHHNISQLLANLISLFPHRYNMVNDHQMIVLVNDRTDESLEQNLGTIRTQLDASRMIRVTQPDTITFLPTTSLALRLNRPRRS